ncbi:ankyrin repeat-containing protein BDA1-like isoform X1 [Gossypium raimondii]|uniref:ankyrin repeat-containing protein BDA1-like isoform X1 n=1 Tax=Gossypium raimondii TaxID=29730 RepID=UPI00227AF361|nr:ankyrin repeat-containing protein BDA1-like isoform X1 [Gossypium raimondii]
MDERLRTAARTGNVSDLYSLIEIDGNALKQFDEEEFVETPLHIAAEEGYCIRFAMEMMSLKPSFASKLNKQGLTPLHLAVTKGHTSMVLRFLEINKDLARVKGKNGKTPLHIITEVGNHNGLLDRVLEICPQSIRDVTVENRNALHIAVKNDRLDVLRVLLQTLRKTDCYRDVVNQKDQDGNTALHLAAFHNQPEMLKLLLNCNADQHATNQAGLMALDIADQNHNEDSITVLRGCFIPGVSNFKHNLEKQVRKASSLISHEIDNISGEDRNALLVILGLLLTATFQASLSPPGGVWQGDNTSKSEGSYDEMALGKSILDEFNFLFYYIPTYLVFIVTFFLTLALLKPYPHCFRTALQVLLAFFAMSFDLSVSFIAPTRFTTSVMAVFSVLVFILTVLMVSTSRVSKLSVAILGCRLSASFALHYYMKSSVLPNVIQGVWLFLFLHDEFWKGTILVAAYCLAMSTLTRDFTYCIVFGCWFSFFLFRVCLNRFLIHRV